MSILLLLVRVHEAIDADMSPKDLMMTSCGTLGIPQKMSRSLYYDEDEADVIRQV
jgi:hypothetical protein